MNQPASQQNAVLARVSAVARPAAVRYQPNQPASSEVGLDR